MHNFCGWGGYGGFLGMVFWIALIVGVVFLVRWIVREHPSRSASSGGDSALDILKKRYAAGEINKEEFEQRKKDLLE